MNRLDHLLVIVGEEAVEIAHRASKALRFGPHEVQPGQNLTNMERLIGEVNDLLAVLGMVAGEGLPIDGMGAWLAIEEKREKVEQFLRLSAECGRLDAPAAAGEAPGQGGA